jgi:hypothetical protein
MALVFYRRLKIDIEIPQWAQRPWANVSLELE